MANYGYKGWIKLWREEMHNPLYREEPFTKWQAWIDLCMMADSEGTVKTSLKALKNRWLWGSVKKVRNYLGTVEDIGLGTVTAIPKKGTLITINKDFSNKSPKLKKDKKGTVKGTESGTEEVLPKEVVAGTSLEISPATNNSEEINTREESNDEYGYE